MTVDPEEFRRRYAQLSDEELLAVDRDELADLARQCYDEELARRGLELGTEAGDDVGQIEEFASAARFLFPDEAKLARALLLSAGILCYIENEHTLSAVWTWTYVLGGLRLMVPASLVEQTREILDTPLPEDEIDPTIVPSLGRSNWRARTIMTIAILCAPAVEYLRLVYVFR